MAARGRFPAPERWEPDIDLLQAFDEGEWLRVQREHGPRLLGQIKRSIRDAQAREDVLQETLLGAVRGMSRFDRAYRFEQYLFGICRNRTIDHLRRLSPHTTDRDVDDDDDVDVVESLAVDEETPLQALCSGELERRARALLVALLRAWVQETWELGRFTHLMVVEALLCGGWRNKDTWARFGLPDETAVAGIKFRAFKAMRRMATEVDGEGRFLAEIRGGVEEGLDLQGLDVATVWREERVSCPARHWLARMLTGALSEGQRRFLDFHLDEMDCAHCQARRDELVWLDQAAELQALADRARGSSLRLLCSRRAAGPRARTGPARSAKGPPAAKRRARA